MFGFKTIHVKSESMVNRTRINSAQSIFFWNITRRQAISPVAKFHHVLGRGFMIQRVTFIFIKGLSANQNQTILHESIKKKIYKPHICTSKSRV